MAKTPTSTKVKFKDLLPGERFTHRKIPSKVDLDLPVFIKLDSSNARGQYCDTRLTFNSNQAKGVVVAIDRNL